jgi:chemotaxis protein MotB
MNGLRTTARGILSPHLPVAAPRGATTGPWLITIVDLITLLLTFFVLLFSMSHVESKRYQAVVQSYGEAFAKPGPKLPALQEKPGDDLGYLQAVLKTAFTHSSDLNGVEFRRTPQYLMLSLPATELFMPGSGGFSEAAKGAVFDLSGVLSNVSNRIAVVGTVAIEPGLPADASWQLAIARARTMADALTRSGYSRPIAVLGRGGAATDVAAALGRIDIMIMPGRP